MSISNYSELQAAVSNWLARSDLTDRIVEFVALGESHLNKKLRLLQQETSASVSLSASSDTAALPTGFLEVIDLRYSSDDWQLRQLMVKDLNRLKTSATYRPNHFAVSNTFVFDASADQAYTLKCNHFEKWDIATDTTNWLLTNHPEVYLAASLFEAFSYIRKTEDAMLWQSRRDAGIKEANTLDARSRRNVIAKTDDALLTSSRFNINRGY